MSETSTSLQNLIDRMGERAEDLRHAPYELIIAEPLHDEPDAIDIKILLGYTRMRNTPFVGTDENVLSEGTGDDSTPNSRHYVWIHLYPPQSPFSHPEIHFHEYTSNGTHVARLDGDNICRALSETAKAFTSPTARKWSKSKLLALAKYYFLRKIAETNTVNTVNEDRQVLRMAISKTFKDDLTAVCRDLKEAEDIKKKSRTRRNESLFVAENESDSSDGDVAKEETDSSTTTISGLPEPSVEASEQDTMRSLLELSRDESRIESDTNKIKEEMLALQKRRDTLVQEKADKQKRMADMLDGMSVGAAFMLGRQVERETASKRRRNK